MSNSVYKATYDPGEVEDSEFEREYGDLSFKVSADTINTQAPLIKSIVEDINQSKNLSDVRPKINYLVANMIFASKYQEIAVELQPEKLSKVCQVIFHPAAKKTTEFSFNILPDRPNKFQFLVNNFNLFNNFEVVSIGRKYCFENRADARFIDLFVPLPSLSSVNFRLTAKNQNLNSTIKQNSIRARVQYKFKDSIGVPLITNSYIFGLVERGNSMKKYTNPSDLVRSQLFKLKFKKSWELGDKFIGARVSCGIDPIRDQVFSKLSAHIQGIHLFGMSNRFGLMWKLRGGGMVGKNIALNDEFNYRQWKDRARMFVNGKLCLQVGTHPIFSGLGIAPYSFVEGWLSQGKSLSFRNLRKEMEAGVGFYINPLKLNVEFGLIDVEGTTLRPSSRFRLGVQI